MANEKLINSRLQLKIDYDYNWEKATTFVPKPGEPIIYKSEGCSLMRLKIGNGNTIVNDLPFINIPYMAIETSKSTQVYQIIEEYLVGCYDQHVLIRNKEKLLLVYFKTATETEPIPILYCTCLTNGGYKYATYYGEEIAFSYWDDFILQVWQAGLESLCDEWAEVTNNPMVLCKPYSGSENGYVGRIQETTVQYHTTSGSFPKVTSSNNQSITSGDAFLSHFDTGLSEQVTITDLLNVYSLYYEDTCSGMRLGSSKNVGSITITCPYEFEVQYVSYFSYNSSTGEIVGQDDSWISVDGDKSHLGVNGSGSVWFTGGTHTISTCVDENGAHQGRIIITGFTISSSSGPAAEYNYYELARTTDIQSAVDDVYADLDSTRQAASWAASAVDTLEQKIAQINERMGDYQIFHVEHRLPKADSTQLNNIYAYQDELYKCISQGEGEHLEYSLAIAGTSEITVAQLTAENSPVYGELGKTFKENIEIGTNLVKVFRNDNSIKLGSSSATGSICFMNLHKLPIRAVTIGFKAYNAKGSCFEICDDYGNIENCIIEAQNTDEVLYTIEAGDEPDKLNNLTISTLAMMPDSSACDKRGCLTRLIIDYGEVVYAWKPLTGTSAQLVTWQELKTLRDSSLLIPGQKYCITDYQCTTTQKFTSAENNSFYITVEALAENILSENATASINTNLAQPYFKDSVMATAQVTSRVTVAYVMHTDGEAEANYWNPMKEIFVHYRYESNNDGDIVPVIYKTERAGVDFTLPDYDPEEFGEPDWEDTYYYVSDYTQDGKTYNLWRKIDNDELSWDSAETYHILTNMIVETIEGQPKFSSLMIGSSEEEGTLLYTVELDEPQIIPTYVELLSYEMIDWDLVEVSYLNEDAPFIHSAAYEENPEGQMVPVLYNWSEDEAETRPEECADKYYFIGVETMNGQKCNKWRKIEPGNGLEWDDTSKVYVYTNDIIEYRSYFSNNDLSRWELKYCLDNDTSRFAWALDSQAIINLDSYSSNGQPLVRQPDFDGSDVPSDYSDYLYAWGTAEDVDDGDPTDFIYSKNESLTNGEEVYNANDDEIQIAQVVDLLGKGVIYYMKDEFNNECPYDFKNIKFDCSARWQNAVLSLESSSMLPALYTFEYTTSGKTLLETVLYLGDGSINGHAKQNIIKPAYNDQHCQILNHIVLYQTQPSLSSVITTSYIYNNNFDLNNTNIIMTNNTAHGILSNNICGPNVHNCSLYCQKGNNLFAGNNKYIIIPAREYPYWFDWYVCGQPGQTVNAPNTVSETPVKFVTACTEYII